MPQGTAPANAPSRMPTEVIHVDQPVVACDGGVGALGHPRVFLRIVEKEIMCPYCSRLFILSDGADHGYDH